MIKYSLRQLYSKELRQLHKEIDIIQNCVTRMSNNSFMLKGWFLTLVSGITVLTYEDWNIYIIALLFCITMIFWYLDAYYLRAERLYIKLYNWVIKDRDQEKEVYEYRYELDPNKFDQDVPSTIRIMFTRTLTPIYCSGIIGIILILIRKICTKQWP